VIPARNELPNIAGLFDDLGPSRRLLRHVVLADNGSTDGTAAAAAARGAVVVHEPRRGYGGACLAALRWIEAQAQPPEAVAFLDADRSDDPAALPALLEPIAGRRADLVIGSRRRLAEPGALGVAQRFGNRLACGLTALLTGRRYSDLGPFRAVRWRALRSLRMRDTTWGWTVEMQVKAALRGLRVVEVDVPYRRRAAGRSKISRDLRGAAAAGSRILLTVLRVWWEERSHSDRRSTAAD
jgi:glycosyltransferase involved in cell wall biosynthesis